jgi:hypothetical protein
MEEADNNHRTAVDAHAEAMAWLERFAPLLDHPAALTGAEREERLARLPDLRAEGPLVLERLEAARGPEAGELSDVIREALQQIDDLELDLRRGTAPGRPEEIAGATDVASIRSRLAAAAARREIGALSDGETGPRLTLAVAPGSRAAAVMLGIVSVATGVLAIAHAYFMLPFLTRMFGIWGYAVLALDAMGLVGAWAAANAALLIAADERVELAGERLTLHRHVCCWDSPRQVTLSPESRAAVSESYRSGQSQWGTRTSSVEVSDAAGQLLCFAYGRPQSQQERLVIRINEYIDALAREPVEAATAV